MKDKIKKVLPYIKQMLSFLIAVLLLAAFLNQFVLYRMVVAGESMMPTLQDGDHLFCEKVSMHFREFQRNDSSLSKKILMI